MRPTSGRSAAAKPRVARPPRRDQQDRVIARDRRARVGQHGQPIRRDPPVGREGGDHVRLAARQRAVHEGRAVRRRRREAQRIGAPHRRPFGRGRGTPDRCPASAPAHPRPDRRASRCRCASRILAAHRKGIGVLEPERARAARRRASPRPARDRRHHSRARRHVAALHRPWSRACPHNRHRRRRSRSTSAPNATAEPSPSRYSTR